MGAFIDDHREAYGVEPICGVLPIAPSTYHAQKAREADPDLRPARLQRDEELRGEVRRVWEANRSGGLLLRSAEPVAARDEREHERAAAAVLPEGDRPRCAWGNRVGCGGVGAQHAAEEDLGLADTSRSDGGAPAVDTHT